MLRDLASVLVDLQAGLQSAAGRAGVRLTDAGMTLPVDTALALKDGTCLLLADVVRSYADAGWREQPAKLVVDWTQVPTEDLLPAGEARHG